MMDYYERQDPSPEMESLKKELMEKLQDRICLT